jgi:hypothetical protein
LVGLETNLDLKSLCSYLFGFPFLGSLPPLLRLPSQYDLFMSLSIPNP